MTGCAEQKPGNSSEPDPQRSTYHAADQHGLQGRRSDPRFSRQRRPELVAAAQREIEVLHGDKEELQKVSEDLTSLVSQREQDMLRAKERMEAAITELETKLNNELRIKSVMLPFFFFSSTLIWYRPGISSRTNLPALSWMLVMQKNSLQRGHARLLSTPL